MNVLVTGYVPIQGHPRSAAEYGELGELFTKLDYDKAGCLPMPFYETVQETWLWKEIKKIPAAVTHSEGDYPQKNTLAYHCVQHQKFAWLLKAALLMPRAKTVVWVDYGIGHVPGVTADVIQQFMESIKPDDLAIPGCVEREGLLVSDLFPCWRFCGGAIVMPVDRVYKFYKGIKETARRHIRRTHNVTWEVNTLAEAEPRLPPIRWYKADHNETMFTNYGVSDAAS